MKALVTGASGFVGSMLVEELGKQGFEVFALMRKTSDVSNLAGIPYQRVEGDLSNLEALKKAVAGMDYVFHVAGATTAPNRDAFFRHNAEGSRNVALAVAEANPQVKRLVCVSSLAAAGPAPSLDRPRVETEADAPISDYGKSKLEGEREVLKFKDRIPVAIVRPPMVYGPKDKGVFVIIQTVARRLMPVIRGGAAGGHKYYNAIHVRDLARGIALVGMASKDLVPSGELFYLAGSDVTSYENLLGTMAKSLRVKPLKFPIPQSVVAVAAMGLDTLGKWTGKTYPLNQDKLNEILPDYWICSDVKARRVLGFRAEFELAKGMDDAIAWYKENRWL